MIQRLWYGLCGLWVDSAMFLFYRRRVYTGKEKIPMKKGIIFSANHQNAFMDAFVASLAIWTRKQIGFMVRADVFKNKLFGAFLYSLRLIPAYRMRDGVENLSKNDETFEHCKKLLRRRKAFIIFPEANHAIPRRMRTLKKGIARIFFGNQQEEGFNDEACIVPMGINYTDPEFFGGELLINYGEPIYASDYKTDFEENPARAYRNLLKELEHRMRPLMIDIRSKEYYDTIEGALSIATNHVKGRKSDPRERFSFQQEMILRLDEKVEVNDWAEDLSKKVSRYTALRNKLNLRDWVFDHKDFPVGSILLRILLLVITFPVFLAGTAIHYFAFMWPHWFSNQKIKDPAFRSSIKSIIGLTIISLLYYAIIIVSAILLDPWWLAFPVIAGVAISGRIALQWVRVYRKVKAMGNYNAMDKQGKRELEEARKLRKEILEMTL